MALNSMMSLDADDGQIKWLELPARILASPGVQLGSAAHPAVEPRLSPDSYEY